MVKDGMEGSLLDPCREIDKGVVVEAADCPVHVETYNIFQAYLQIR